MPDGLFRDTHFRDERAEQSEGDGEREVAEHLALETFEG